MTTIHIDGSEGGGQLLRSSLSLSLITGQRFRMTDIRGARRPKPGLMRQHLTCVQAAAAVGNALVEGGELGSLELVFSPEKVVAGDYRFEIGTGGSTMLVLQTLLPALWHADGPSTVRVEGGTHNPMAPPFEYVEQCYLPVLATMGAKADLMLDRHGFMQAGGGVIRASVSPVTQWQPLHLVERGASLGEFGHVLSAALPATIAQRQIDTARNVLEWLPDRFELREITDSAGPGNALMLAARYANVSEISTGIAERGVQSETMAQRAAERLQIYLRHTAPVGIHLADQLLLPMALAGGGVFRTLALSKHSLTNMALIEQFLPVQWLTRDLGGHVWEVECKPGSAPAQ